MLKVESASYSRSGSVVYHMSAKLPPFFKRLLNDLAPRKRRVALGLRQCQASSVYALDEVGGDSGRDCLVLVHVIHCITKASRAQVESCSRASFWHLYVIPRTPLDAQLVTLCYRHHRAIEAETKRGQVGKVGAAIQQWIGH